MLVPLSFMVQRKVYLALCSATFIARPLTIITAATSMLSPPLVIINRVKSHSYLYGHKKTGDLPRVLENVYTAGLWAWKRQENNLGGPERPVNRPPALLLLPISCTTTMPLLSSSKTILARSSIFTVIIHPFSPVWTSVSHLTLSTTCSIPFITSIQHLFHGSTLFISERQLLLPQWLYVCHFQSCCT